MKVNFHPSFALRKAQHKCTNMPGGIMPWMNEKMCWIFALFHV